MGVLNLLTLLSAQSPDPIQTTSDLSNLLQKGGLASFAAIFLMASGYLFKQNGSLQKDHAAETKASAEKNAAEIKALTEKHAAELKLLNEQHAKALQDMSEKNRVSEEAKNEKIVGFVGKLTEVVGANTAAMERLSDDIRNQK